MTTIICKRLLFCTIIAAIGIADLQAYPIDGYLYTGIRRLLRLELIMKGELKENPPLPGAQKSMEDIKLHLWNTPRGDSLKTLPEADPGLQKSLNALFPNLHESYSVALLDITPGQPVRYAKRQEDRGFQPGSVGKLAVAGALFCELENLYPGSFEKRQELLKTRFVRGGRWAVYDEHTVPFFDPETKKLVKRQVQENDVFSLYEWADHMLSVSNNGAASVVWREAILMRVFGERYPDLTEAEAEAYFTSTPKAELADLAVSVVNDPLRDLGITADEWRLGLMFTRGASGYIPGKGGSIGSPRGMMKWLVALERGAIVDPESSLEIKRLMYMTDRRIRYAANAKLNEAAVYFKSGSLYKCNRETMPDCGKYRGNVYNYMNSVAIVEQPDGTTYLVALMTNVPKKNSNVDHNALAASIDRIVRS
ncbi:MAG: serine hydrolase [Saprospiraceae bacterium]|nr:serine hydrolase [Saprospiraceae bacterium]